MVSINPYLNFRGNTEEAFNFYRSVFGGEFIGGIKRFKDAQGCENMPATDGEKIMHIALPIGQGNMLMATDAVESMGQTLTEGNNFSLSVDTESEEEADKIFNGLAESGKITMPLSRAFWGDYFGMLTDKFGIQWMISYAENRQN